MATWLDALVVSVTYLLFGAGLIAVLLRSCRPERLRVPEVLVDPRTLTTDSENWGLY